MKLSELQTLAIRISLIEGDLEIRAPRGIVTPIILDEIKQHKPEIVQALKLLDYQTRVKSCKGLNEISMVLKDFRQHKWGICQQSDMSAAYTPVALRFIEIERADKWETLEALASLCWR